MEYIKIIFDYIVAHPWFTLFGTCSLIQLVPIKINPWSKLLNLIKHYLIGDLEKKVVSLENIVMTEKIENKRWNVLDFANTCHQGHKHTQEEWKHCLKELQWYDEYCRDNHVPNGEMIECSKYLRRTYQDLLSKKEFMKEVIDDESSSS